MINNKRVLKFIKDGENKTVEFKTSFQKEAIALMFKECGLIGKYGSGIGRIQKFCKAHGIVEPKFEEMQKSFPVTLYKKKTNGGLASTAMKPSSFMFSLFLIIYFFKNIDFFKSSILEFLGKISFGIYLIHVFLLSITPPFYYQFFSIPSRSSTFLSTCIIFNNSIVLFFNYFNRKKNFPCQDCSSDRF